MKKNLFTLKNYIEVSNPDLVFISEPQIFTSDLPLCSSHFKDEYCMELNSEDKLDEEIAMIKSKADGGTLLMWKKSLDKYITVVTTPTASFLPIVYSPPSCPVTVHIALYLPTSGKEADFVEQILLLSNCLDDLKEKHKDCLIFLRGDGNVNCNNKPRSQVFSDFLSRHSLIKTTIPHKTYHHFLGGGAFDSDIDIIAHSEHAPHKEIVSRIFCKHEFPDIDSHHDIIISSVELPAPVHQHPELISAPRLDLSRHRISWCDDGIAKYEAEVSQQLSNLRQRWLNPSSRTSLAILLEYTNNILNRAAVTHNSAINLNKKRPPKTRRKPVEVKESEKQLFKAHKNTQSSDPLTQQVFRRARKEHRRVVRHARLHDENIQNERIFTLLSSNPSSAFRTIKSLKSSDTVQVPYIKVGEKTYEGNRVIDGLFESISRLKTSDPHQVASSPYYNSLMQDYNIIRFLCSKKIDLPAITLKRSTAILHKIKPKVMDLFSVTAYHYIHAGIAGHVHFNLLLNAFITDVNNTTLVELNTVLALLLYKGHKKDRTLDSSYRTISTCPLIAKGLDIYVRELAIEKWNGMQAATQYQGEGSNHELAAILVTEAIQHSKFVTKRPIFLLFLDAKSAFDTVHIPYLVRCLYRTGMESQAVLYLENRLSNRVTFCEFDKTVVGPIKDQQGLEQGGVSSSDLYKLFNNELLDMCQKSKLGVKLSENLAISAVGQADDTVLMSNTLERLQLLCHLLKEYCLKFMFI